MGNCKSAKCGQPRQVYKSTLDEIFKAHGGRPAPTMNTCIYQFSFYILFLLHSIPKPNDSFFTAQTKTGDPTQTDLNIDVPKIQAHVRVHVKNLIEHLESDQSKLVDTGKYLEKVITNTPNPETHLIGIFVLHELINEFQKFSNEKINLQYLQKTKTKHQEEFSKINKDVGLMMIEREDTDYSNGSKRAFSEAILQFEASFKEIILYLLDADSNPFSTIFDI